MTKKKKVHIVLMSVLTVIVCTALTATALAATLYVDHQLPVNCTGNYSIAARNCTGSDGNAYRTPASALTASGVGDTIKVRQGAYALTSSIMPKAGQTWQRYGSESVVLDGQSGAAPRIFHVSNVANVTLDGFTLTGARYQGVWATIGADGGTCTNTTVRNMTISNWNWANQNYYGAIKYSQCQGGRIESNTVQNPKFGVAAGQLSSGGIDLGGNCSTLAGGGTTVAHNTVVGNDIGQGIRLDVCAGSVFSPGGKHIVEQNLVENTRLGLHVEAGSSGVFRYNTVRNSGVLSFESRSRGNATDDPNTVEVIHNTFDRAGWNLVRFIESNAGALSHATFTDNVLTSNNEHPAVLVEHGTSASPTNDWNNNVITNTGSGAKAVCWNAPSNSGVINCPAGATLYTTAQLALFQSGNRATGSTSTGPHEAPLPVGAGATVLGGTDVQEIPPAARTGAGGGGALDSKSARNLAQLLLLLQLMRAQSGAVCGQ